MSGQILGTLVTVDIVLQDSGAVSATSDAGAETETDGEASSRWAVIGGDLVTCPPAHL